MTEDLKEWALTCLQAISKDLSPYIQFRYIAADWNDFRDCPVVTLWQNRPVYKHGCDDYGEEWEGWQPKSDKESFIAMISTEFLFSILRGCPKDMNWSELIMERKNEN